jgi:hypothetical protein
MLLAEEIAKKTDEARKETYVDRRFKDIVSTINERAAAMQGSLVIKKLTKYGLAHPAEVQWLLQTGMPMSDEVKARYAEQGTLEPSLVDSLYEDQKAVNDRLTNEGFVLTEKPLDLPSLLDPKLDDDARKHVEALHGVFECEVVISWEHLTTEKS